VNGSRPGRLAASSEREKRRKVLKEEEVLDRAWRMRKV
jgi:hypothetical protein